MWPKVLITITISFCFLFLMSAASFPDLINLTYTSAQSPTNTYTWVAEHHSQCIWTDASYPPLYFFFMGTYLRLLGAMHLVPALLFQLDSCPVGLILYDRLLLILIKLPFLIAHLLTGLIFSLFFVKSRFRWFLYWILNPISIFVSFIEGQFDSLPILLVMLALLLLRRHKFIDAGVFLGLGIGFKHYPLIIVLPLLLTESAPISQLAMFIVSLVSTYLLTLLPSIFDSRLLQGLTFPENSKMLLSQLHILG